MITLAALVQAGQAVLRHAARTEILDRVYVIAAGCFVSLLPVLLYITGALGSSSTGDSVIATELIERLGLTGAAADAVHTLLPRGSVNFYLTGVLVTLFGAFSLSRRAARAYAAIWQVPDLPPKQLWRGLVWLLLQLASIGSVAVIRDQARPASTAAKIAWFAAAVIVWYTVELVAQRLITRGQVAWRRLNIAAGLVATGRLLVALWATIYLAGSLTRQADLYGPIGVVFSMFSSIFAAIAATLIATLIAASLTQPATEGEPA